jgi:SAM-dependent methyltransferase
MAEPGPGPGRTAGEAAPAFRDGAFDVTIAVTVCEFTASPAALVAELARVTRPGGRVVIGALNRRSPWGLARRRQMRKPPWQAARFLTRRQLRALGTRHGQARLHGTLIMPGAVPGSRLAGCFLEAIDFHPLLRHAPPLGPAPERAGPR